MKYRFSTNYAALKDTPEDKLAAHKLAGHLYDLRSKIAHGSALDAVHKVGADKVNLAKAGSLSTQYLRELIHFFMRFGKNPPYKDPEFWIRKHYGVTNQKDA